MRSPCILHCTPEPFQFFGRAKQLALLDDAFAADRPSLVAMVGPGGQGKTAIVRTWLQQFLHGRRQADGVFLWSFYRGKDGDLCLRELYRYAEGMDQIPEVSASYCVDRLMTVLRRERWAVVFDGTEVVQHESGSWYGRFVHPELGRFLEEVASAPLPGVVVLTSRFPLPMLEHRKFAHLVALSSLDRETAAALLRSLGVQGKDAQLEEAANVCGHHAKAVELLGTYLVHFCRGHAAEHSSLPNFEFERDASDEENKVARVLTAFRQSLSEEAKDIVALATAFRQPPTEERLLQYLASAPLNKVLHQIWGRKYRPFVERSAQWLAQQIQELIDVRLLERVHSGRSEASGELVIDAHPLVRRGFESILGGAGHREQAQARAGFLRGRPDRKPPASLEGAREEVELFHAYCDARMWNDADSVYVALDNPKHRFLAPAFERDLLLQFFPGRDWRSKPLWPGFGRYRSLAICFELLGRFDDALEAYPPSDAPLRGDALIALGEIEPILRTGQVTHPWQNLWQAYRAHALCLAGRTAEAVAVAKSLVPVDVYEWVHVFECLLRVGQLHSLDLKSILYRPAYSTEHHWSQLARQRMKLDYQRQSKPDLNLDAEFRRLLEEYDRGGLPFERVLTRLSYGRLLLQHREFPQAGSVVKVAFEIAQRNQMRILAADVCELKEDLARQWGRHSEAEAAGLEGQRLRQATGYRGASRP